PHCPPRSLHDALPIWRRADSNRRIGVLQTPALAPWLLRLGDPHCTTPAARVQPPRDKKRDRRPPVPRSGAEDGTRTRDLRHGKADRKSTRLNSSHVKI